MGRPKVDHSQDVCTKCGYVGNYRAKGLCKRCYGSLYFQLTNVDEKRAIRLENSKQWNRNNRERFNENKRRWAAGEPRPVENTPQRVCTACGGESAVFAKGLCHPCYGKMRHRLMYESDKLRRLAVEFKVAPEFVKDLHDAAAGLCQICKAPQKQLALDHCHTSGKIRNFLCHSCNLMLGFIEKTGPTNLLSAVAYLIKYEASNFVSKTQKELSLLMNNINRITECEYENLDKSAGDCHGSPTHILRDAGLVVCGAHVDGAELLLKAEAELIKNSFNPEKKNEPQTIGLASVEPTGSQHVPSADPSERSGIVLPTAGVPGPDGSAVVIPANQ